MPVGLLPFHTVALSLIHWPIVTEGVGEEVLSVVVAVEVGVVNVLYQPQPGVMFALLPLQYVPTTFLASMVTQYVVPGLRPVSQDVTEWKVLSQKASVHQLVHEALPRKIKPKPYCAHSQ